MRFLLAQFKNFGGSHRKIKFGLYVLLNQNFPFHFAAADRSNSYFWVGGSDEEVDDIWKWYTESSPMTYTNWYPGEPNGRQGSNCITLWGAHNYAWADGACSSQINYICEKRLDLYHIGHQRRFGYLSHMRKTSVLTHPASIGLIFGPSLNLHLLDRIYRLCEQRRLRRACAFA